jgi:LmbE family N-acetylglucosaminyl deacetylase
MFDALRPFCKYLRTSIAVLAVVGCAAIFAQQPQVNPDAMPLDLDRGTAGLCRVLTELRTRASVLMVTAHPDDEDGGMLAEESRGRGARATLLTLNRGEGGQNAMSVDMYDELGLVRTQELLQADRYYGVDQYWTRVIDYGFSKTREEALDKWGYERVLSDVVRVIRMTRPLVLTSVFSGAPTDGHGNHEVAGQMAQEAFVAAADPKRFPEQIQQGLRPWAAVKVYARVPFFAPTKDNTIYDYATDKYVPIRFYNYVDKTWMTQRPPTNLEVAEGTLDPVEGLSFLQMSRTGWGLQKTQNGGNTTPPPGPYTGTYHRYASRIPAADKEKTFYDGIDTSLAGIATLAAGDTRELTAGLQKIDALIKDAAEQLKPNHPAAIAPQLADALKQMRELIQRTESGSLAEPGRSDALFELRVKEKQLQHALRLSLGVYFDAAVAPEKEPDNRFDGGQSITFTTAVPGQKFTVQTLVDNGGSEAVKIGGVDLASTDGKSWGIKLEGALEAALGAGKQNRAKFSVTAPDDAALTRAYFSRPNLEQPYYNLNDERYQTLSLAPYPLTATARLQYRDVDFTIAKVVQAAHRLEGTGIVEDPLLVAPVLSVTLASHGGAVPLDAKTFAFPCTLHSNAKGAAEGTLRLRLPPGWVADPATMPFNFAHDGDEENFSFQVTPRNIQAKDYEIRAVAELKGKTYEEGYRMVGYPGVRLYPSYLPAAYKATGVNVKVAPGLKVGFVPGTGDDVPLALEDLGLHVISLTATDVQNLDLASFDVIVLGVRAYTKPDIRAVNGRLLSYVKNGGALVVQYNLQNFDGTLTPFPLSLGPNAAKVVDEGSAVTFLQADNPVFAWPNKIAPADFNGWEEERGHGFPHDWDSAHYMALVETHDPDQDPQKGGLLVAHYGRGVYVYDAFALYRQLPAGVPGAYRILANLVSIGKNPEWK